MKLMHKRKLEAEKEMSFFWIHICSMKKKRSCFSTLWWTSGNTDHWTMLEHWHIIWATCACLVGFFEFPCSPGACVCVLSALSMSLCILIVSDDVPMTDEDSRQLLWTSLRTYCIHKHQIVWLLTTRESRSVFVEWKSLRLPDILIQLHGSMCGLGWHVSVLTSNQPARDRSGQRNTCLVQ